MLVIATIVFLCSVYTIIGWTQSEIAEPIRESFEHEGKLRDYYIWLPGDFDSTKTYWLTLMAHGGGDVNNGRTYWMTPQLRRTADEAGLQTIIVSPTFDKDDPVAQRYPAEAEGRFTRKILRQMNDRYNLHSKILLTGYSRGGQFAHRFALWNPELVHACAPLAAGAWTTPDGRLLDYTVGEIKEPERLPESLQSSQEINERLADPRVARFGGQKPGAGAEKIPFLVMCGSLDVRIDITRQFVNSLGLAGFEVETDWPRTPHTSRGDPQYSSEFRKYIKRTIEFFMSVTASAQ